MTEEPPKFIKDPSTGTRKLNPAWKDWKDKNATNAATSSSSSSSIPALKQQEIIHPSSQAADVINEPTFGGGPSNNALGQANMFLPHHNAPPPTVSVAKPMPNIAFALPVISSIGEQQKYLGPDTKISQNSIDARRNYQTDIVAQSIGVPTAELMNQLDYVFAKYEIPMGLLDKMMIISSLDFIELIIDDSGSMDTESDQKDAHGRPLTRWGEVKERLRIMFEVLAYIPFKGAELHFLNRRDVIGVHHKSGEPPQVFIARVNQALDAMWVRGPSGSTPALQRIRESLRRRPGQFVARYFFGDGVPDGGKTEQEQITDLLLRRSSPARNPFTFMSCSENDEDCEWMKEAEEIAPYAGEYDDYYSEAQEVLGDQGVYFPFSMGFYICGMLVGALYPETIDNLDEAVPFTKATMNELLGYELSNDEYNAYFQGFLNAQLKKKIESGMDRVKVNYAKNVWPKHREEFRNAKKGSDIPVFQQYQKELAGMTASSSSRASTGECDCVIQ